MEREAKGNGGYAGFGTATATTTAAAPDAAALQGSYDGATTLPGVGAPTTPMTIADVIAKTAVMFTIVFVFAFGSWQLELSTGWSVLSMLVATGLAFWGILSKKIRPLVFLGYSLFMGIALGGISLMWAQYATQPGQSLNSDIVVQAIIGTFGAFAAMLFLYGTRIIKVTERFKRFMLIALVGYLFIALASFVAALFGVGDGLGFRTGGIGLLICVAGVALAAFSLALDFDAIETAVKAGAPEQESWRGAFGLIITLVWLYLEILRLLAIINRS